MFYVKNVKRIIFLLFFVVATNIFASSSNARTVNILTWWGYLNYPEIQSVVKKQCGINISYDQYYSNNEFIRRFNKHTDRYDIIIFSNTIYNLIRKDIPPSKANLKSIVNKYNSTIKKHYFTAGYPKNVIYFMLSLSGFLWNPEILNISEKDTIQSIFKKSGNNIVIMIDDPVETWNLLNRGYNAKAFSWSQSYEKSFALTEINFKKLIQSSNVYITNSFNELYNKKNFAFAFMWTGGAIGYLKNSKNKLKFMVHPDLSYISSDLISNLNDSSSTICVMKALVSKEVSDVIQKNDYYVSPYGDYKSITDEVYQEIYDQMFRQLDSLLWLIPVEAKDYESLTDTWGKIQLNLLSKNAEN